MNKTCFMDKKSYSELEQYMKECMEDSAHDKEHIYRVLYAALEIAGEEEGVDYDVLICACLLHDIGRQEQFENPKVCHAEAGAKKAYRYLRSHGYSEEFAARVADCIREHRFRSGVKPESLESRILFDADKADVTGALGIARTLLYEGNVSTPIFTRTAAGEISDGIGDKEPSFFREYKKKLEGIYDKFYTKRGKEIAAARREAAKAFYDSLLHEVNDMEQNGRRLLAQCIVGEETE